MTESTRGHSWTRAPRARSDKAPRICSTCRVYETDTTRDATCAGRPDAYGTVDDYEEWLLERAK